MSTSFAQMLENITPDIYEGLKLAVEIGKWPDGRKLSRDQVELCLQAVIAYEAKHLDERERVGFIDRGSKAEGELCDDDHAHDHGEPQALRWLESQRGG